MDTENLEKEKIDKERHHILDYLEQWLETPMIILGFIWLILLVIDILYTLNPILKALNNLIWIIFITDFLIKFIVAPKKLAYIKKNWLTVVSLFLPALRIFAVFRALRFLNILAQARGFRLIQIITATNRGMGSLSKSMSRRGLGYVITLTVIILFAGAAGMYAFENDNSTNGLKNYGSSLWWTAMLMTTIGSEYWPKTPEGKILCFILSLYSMGVLGYLTAALATFFVESDASNKSTDIAGADSIEELRKEIILLKELIEKNNIG